MKKQTNFTTTSLTTSATLLQNIEKYSEFFDSVPTSLFQLSKDGKIIAVNLCSSQMLSKERSELIKSKFDFFITNNTKPIFTLFLQKVFSSKTKEICELTLSTNRNLPLNVQLTGIAIENRETCFVTMIDISDSKRTEGMFQDSIEKNPMSIQITDKEGFSLYVNPAHTSLFHSVPPSDYSVFYDPQFKQKKGFEELFQLLKNGESVTFPDQYYNVHDFYTEYPDVPLWLRVIGFPIKDSNGKPERFIFMHENITERKQSEVLLKQIRHNYETFFNTIDEFLFVLNGQGEIIHTNTTVIDRLGYARKELLGQSVLKIHPPERRDEAGRIVDEMIRGLTEFCPVPLITKSGVPIPVETRVSHGFWDGKPVIFGVSKDISKLKLSEEKFSKLFHLNPCGCGLSDLDNHRYIEVNEAFCTLLGYEKSEVIDKTAIDLRILTPETIKTVLLKTDRNGAVTNTEVNLKAKNGDIKHVLLSAENIYIQENKYRFTVVNDITDRKNAEKALFESEEKHRQLIENSHDIIYTINSDGVLVFISPAWTALLGHPVSQVVGQQVQQFLHPEDIPTCLTFFQKVIETGQRQKGVEYRVKHLNGKWYWHMSSAVPLRDKTGTIIGFEGISTDITERKSAETRINLSSKILNLLNKTDILADAIRLTTSLIQNETGFEAIGIRLKNGDDYPYFDQHGLDDDFLKTENTLLEHTKDGGICKDKNGNSRLECTCGLVILGQIDSRNSLFTEGGSFWTNNSTVLLGMTDAKEPRHNPRNRCIHEGFLSIALIPLRNKGEIVGLLQLNDRRKDCFTLEMIKFFENIGEIIGIALMRKQAEEALGLSQKLLFNLSAQVPGVIYQYRLYSDGRSCFPYSSSGINDIYEVSSDEIRENAAPFFERLHPDDTEKVSESIFESARTLQQFHCEYRVVLPRQGIRWCYSNATPERMEDNSTIWYGVSYDITDRKNIEQELLKAKEKAEESDRLKSAFLNNISHEIRTPLNGILGFSELLLDIKNSTEERVSYVKIIKKSGNDLIHILNNIVDLSRLKSGSTKINCHPFEVSSLLSELQNEFALETEAKGLKFNLIFKIDSKDNIVSSDKSKIYKILYYIVENAIKFTFSGAIDLGCFREMGYLVFFIRDTGIGIPANEYEKIFEYFRQLEETETKNFGGTGIGLSLAKALTELLGGRIWVESELGKGSCFYVKIPLSEIYDQTKKKKGKKGVSNKRRTILIAEDDFTNFVYLRTTLTNEGHTIIHAKDGQAAVSICATNDNIDIILMDIKMPFMNGLIAAKLISSQKPLMPIIILTAYNSEDMHSEASSCGCVDFITKPISKVQLINVINKYI